jgi:hypothetical protein
MLEEINDITTQLKDKIKNLQINSCSLCMINNKELDHFIFFNAVDSEKLNNYLEDNNIHFSVDDDLIKKHKTHIYIEQEPQTLDLEEVNDISIIDGEIKKTKKQLEILEKTNDNMSPQTSLVRNRLSSLLELKRRYTQNDEAQGTSVDVHELLKQILKRD